MRGDKTTAQSAITTIPPTRTKRFIPVSSDFSSRLHIRQSQLPCQLRDGRTIDKSVIRPVQVREKIYSSVHPWTILNLLRQSRAGPRSLAHQMRTPNESAAASAGAFDGKGFGFPWQLLGCWNFLPEGCRRKRWRRKLTCIGITSVAWSAENPASVYLFVVAQIASALGLRLAEFFATFSKRTNRASLCAWNRAPCARESRKKTGRKSPIRCPGEPWSAYVRGNARVAGACGTQEVH